MTTTPITYGKIRTIGLSIPIHCKWHFDSRCERSPCLRTMLYSAKRSAHQIVSEAKNTARSSSPRTSTVSPVPSGLKSYVVWTVPYGSVCLTRIRNLPTWSAEFHNPRRKQTVMICNLLLEAKRSWKIWGIKVWSVRCKIYRLHLVLHLSTCSRAQPFTYHQKIQGRPEFKTVGETSWDF